MNRDNLDILAQKLDLLRARWVGANELYASCPFARWKHKGKDRKPSFSIRLNDTGESVYSCFGCKMFGTLMSLIGDLDDYRGESAQGLEDWIIDHEPLGAVGDDEWEDDRWEAAARQPSVPGKRRPVRETLLNELRRAQDTEVYAEAEAEDFLRAGPPAYAAERAISAVACRTWEIGDDPVDRRMIYLIRRRGDRKLVGIRGRTYGDSPYKVVTYLPWSQAHFLYGEHLVDDRPGKIVVTEGEIDAIKVWMAGYAAVSLMGSCPSREQTRKLIGLRRDIVLLPDNDGTGRRWGNTFGAELLDDIDIYDAFLPKGVKDADVLAVRDGLPALAEVIEAAKPRIWA